MFFQYFEFVHLKYKWIMDHSKRDLDNDPVAEALHRMDLYIYSYIELVQGRLYLRKYIPSSVLSKGGR
jgi:hypothetical protein